MATTTTHQDYSPMREVGLSAMRSFPYYRKKINDVAFCQESSLLEPCQESTIPGRITQPPPPIELEDGSEYEVATVGHKAVNAEDHTTLCGEEEPTYRRCKTEYAQRERKRERGTKSISLYS